MLQIYKSTLNLPNYIPFGMALRALGQDLKVGMVISKGLFKDMCVFLKATFPEDFYYQTWEELDDDFIEPLHLLFCVEPNSVKGAWEWVEKVIKRFGEKDIKELVVVDSSIPRAIEESSHLFTEVDVTSNKTGRFQSKIITGHGKGKTTYALGEALYYASLNYPSLVLQFIKSPKEYGEVRAINRLPNIEIKSMGKGFPPEEGSFKWELHKKAAQEAWNYFLGLLNRSRYAFIVLDEINIALKYAYLELNAVKELLKNLPQGVKIALTGRYADPELFAYVDQIVQMKEIRHPFQMGIKARRGIEF